MCHWLENSSRVEVGEVLALSRNLDRDCRCAVHRAPADILRVSRNFKEDDLLLVILPQAEARVPSIKVMRPPCRHMRFVPQHLLKEESKVTALPMHLLVRVWGCYLWLDQTHDCLVESTSSGFRSESYWGLSLLKCAWGWWIDSPRAFVRCSWVYVVSQGRLWISSGEPKIQI